MISSCVVGEISYCAAVAISSCVAEEDGINEVKALCCEVWLYYILEDEL